MQYVADGPDIPLDVLVAQEDGVLIPFCGAGVSMPAGLPSFKQLVERVSQALAPAKSPLEELEWEGRNYDRVLHLLQDRFGATRLRGEVQKRLATPANPDLTTHRAILDIATDPHGSVRAVTTNFDLLFEAAREDLPTAAAPLLPVPKMHKWDCLVHLHGRVDAGDPEGRHLTLTSGDFGVAYLVERWASRFVSELFVQGSVLFIGYSLNDPVMRYLVDAIAAERAADNRLYPAFALAPFEGEEDEARWKATGIVPIFYDSRDDHSLLHQTLQQWAKDWSEGLNSKLNIVSDLGPKMPAHLPKDEVSRFGWAIGESSGTIARHLATQGAEANLGWLAVLEGAGLLSAPAPAGEPGGEIVDDGRTTRRPARLDPVRWELSKWLICHLDDPALLSWVTERGCHLHPDFQKLIRLKLREAPLAAKRLESVWHAIAGGVPLAGERRHDEAHRRVGVEEWSPALRQQVLDALSPCVSNLRVWAYDSGPANEPVDARISVSFDCEVLAVHTSRQLVRALLAREDWRLIAEDLAFELTFLLRRAMDIHSVLGLADVGSDPSSIQRPSIATHEQNRDFHGWTRLIGLVREVFHASSLETARAMTALWRVADYPVFRRLLLYGVQREGVLDPSAVVTLWRADPWDWVWSTDVQVELFAALNSLWGRLDESGRGSLVDLLLVGPPREVFRDDLVPSEWESLRDRSRWERLARLRQGGADLGQAGNDLLDGIEQSNPAWTLADDPTQSFPFWTSSGWAPDRAPSVEELSALTNEGIREALKAPSLPGQQLFYVWRKLVRGKPLRALDVYEELLSEQWLEPAAWSSLAAFRDVALDDEAGARLLSILESMAEGLRRDSAVLRALADVVWTLADDVSEGSRSRLLAVWDDVFRASLDSPETTSQDNRMFAAVNNPIGSLVRALVRILRARPLERDSGIPRDVRARLEQIVHAEGDAAVLGRVLVAGQLALLHDLDADWTRDHVIPLLDWDAPDEAIGSWQGFLFSPWVRPSLWQAIHRHFLATFDHLDAFDGRLMTNLAHLLASVGMQGDGELPPDDAARCLSKLGADGRADVGRWIVRQLRDAESKAGSLWRERVRPWLESAWPWDIPLRCPSVADELALAATLAGDAGAEAMEWIAPRLGRGAYLGTVLREIARRGLVSAASREALDLIDALADEAMPGPHASLREFLAAVSDANPALRQGTRFQRLEEIVLRGG